MNKSMNERRPEKSDDDGPHLRNISINRIVIGKDHRSHDDDAIKNMAVSIREVGVINPVIVAHAEISDDGKSQYTCVSGALRIHGAKEVGYSKIAAIVLEGNENYIQLCGIAADLFRDDLTVLQKAEFLKDWVKIVRTKGWQSAKAGGHQPHDKQLSKAAKALKLSRRMAGRLETIGGLSAEVKKAIKAASLDDSQKSMLAIAKEATDDKQLKKVEEIHRQKNAKKEKPGKAKQKDSKLPKTDSPDLVNNDNDDDWDDKKKSADEEQSPANEESPEAEFFSLKAAWQNSPGLVSAWNAASLPARERFIIQILGHSIRENAPQADQAVGHD
jgi:ParB family transcriptional regulator, chromosome partitioning protein